MFLTTDHPNGGCFWRYPEIVQLLMDVEFRKAQVRRLPETAQQRIVLGDLDRQYSLSEIAIITSAGPARALGMSNKGHLGVGADADVAIYPEQPDNDGFLFSYPRYVLKSGEIVVEEGDVIGGSEGREFIVRPRTTRRSRPTSARSSSRRIRYRSTTIPSRSSGSGIPNR